MWPAAAILSHWLVSNPSVVVGKRVVELGAGCGLTGLTAARIQKDHTSDATSQDACVYLTDFNPVVLENLKRNASLNDVLDGCRVVGLDFYQQSGLGTSGWKTMCGTLVEPADVVVAADIICQPDDAVAAANTIYDTLRPGGSAFVVLADASHRFGVDCFASECRRAGLCINAQDSREAILDWDDLLKSALESTTGFVDGMSLTFCTVGKPLQ
jgi:predicted nicotinamide N-methyase